MWDCFQCFTVRTNAAMGGLGCAALCTRAGISVGRTPSTCYFFMLIQHIATLAFCIQCLFVSDSELAFPWHGSPRALQPHLWEDNRHKPRSWAQQGQAECVSRGPWPGPTLAKRMNQESLLWLLGPLWVPAPSLKALSTPHLYQNETGDLVPALDK